MSAKQDALAEAVDLIRRNGLSLDDIRAALDGKAGFRAEQSSGILQKVLGYIGGILAFSGLGLFTAMQWDELNSWSRVIITLGSGFTAFVLAVIAAKDERFERAATPLFLVAAFLEPTGIVVALKEFSRGGDPAYGLLFMNGVMALQQGLVFASLRRTVLAFTAIFFGAGFFAIAFDLMHMGHNLESFTLGLSLSFLAWALSHSRHAAISPLYYFVGPVMVLFPLFDWVRGGALEILFLGATCLVIFLSTVARSRTLLFVGTASTIGFICWFSGKYFEHTLGWPIILMLMGFVLIGLSAVAVKLNRKYITQA